MLRPKEETCLGASHNLELLRDRYPAVQVFDAERSYHHTVLTLLDCDALVALLNATTPGNSAEGG